VKAWLGRTRRVHFVGIGGIGMSGIAELLVNLGYEISGSDLKRSAATDRLTALGARVGIGHEVAHLGAPDVVVISSAIARDNPELDEARRRRIPIISRAEMLAELMRLRVGIAVAGAHGKTTTTSMIALVLERAGLDPTAVIGGRLSAFGSNARLGRGEFMVAEADESDRSFLKLSPTLAVITNIDREHLDAYGSFEQIVEAFGSFAERVPFYGAVIACLDDPPVAALIPRLSRRVITYGFHADADVSGSDPHVDARGGRCRVRYRVPGGAAEAGSIALTVPGAHNLLNALAAIAVGLEVGVSFGQTAAALGEFGGVERRFELRGRADGVTVVDDYGHHPTEIAAVLRAARASAPSRIIAVFQPHRFSRTRDLLHDFGPALALADEVVLTDIYPAGEAPLAGATLEVLADAMRAQVPRLRVVRSIDAIPGEIRSIARAGDLVLTLGAGSIGAVGDRILAALKGAA
jgi:UDP-N-acetylmuramate--alanine ligase